MPHKSDVQVALISGGTSGIGFATANCFLKKAGVLSLTVVMKNQDKRLR